MEGENIVKFVKGLEAAINGEDLSQAQDFVSEFFSKRYPCKLMIRNKSPVKEKKFFEYLESLSEKEDPYHEKVNDEIYKRLKKAGHSEEMAKFAATGVSTPEEALEKIKSSSKQLSSRKK